MRDLIHLLLGMAIQAAVVAALTSRGLITPTAAQQASAAVLFLLAAAIVTGIKLWCVWCTPEQPR